MECDLRCRQRSGGVAPRFRVDGGLVAELERYDDLDRALQAAGVSRADEAGPA